MKKPPKYFDIEVEFEGVIYAGSYTFSSGVVMLDSSFGRGSNKTGGDGHEMTARMTFREILQGAKERGEIAG